MFNDKASEVIECTGCGQRYTRTIRKFPCKDSDGFNCVKCGKLIENWNSTTVPSFSIIEEEKQNKGSNNVRK